MFTFKEKFDGLPGVYKISNEEYHASPGISNSHLMQLKKTPMHYKHWLTTEQKETDALRTGSAAGTLILEPETFHSRYIVAPKCDKRTREGKAIWQDIQDKANGREIISDAVAFEAEQIRDSFQKTIGSSAYKGLFSGLIEYSFYWIKDGVLCKCRPDVLSRLGIITDLKTTSSGASPSEFQRSIVNYGYAMQGAWYIEGVLEALKQSGCSLPEGFELPGEFVLVPIESEAPYACAMYQLDTPSLIEGELQCADALKLYKECTEKNHWPGYELTIKQIGLPAYGYKRSNE